MRKTFLLVVAAALLASVLTVRAQIGNGALVVSICGALPQPYVAGSTRSITININGQRC